MGEELRNTLVGACTLIVLLGIGALSFGGKIEAPTGFSVKAAFQWIDGLSVGDDVRLGGVKVGEVAKTELGKHYTALVTLKLDRPYKLSTDASVSIQTDGLFGSKYVFLAQGAEDEVIKAGEEFTETQSPVIVDDLLRLIIGTAESIREKYRKDKKATK